MTAVAGHSPAATSPPPRRWTRWLLVASLALNLLFVGVMAGAIARGGPGPWVSRGGPGNILGFVADLPPERRKALAERGRAARAEVRAQRQIIRQAARARSDALLAEPFDRQRYLDAQTRQIDAETRLRLMLRDVVADTAAAMTADERKAFLRWRPAFRGALGEEPDEPPAKP